MTPAEFNKARFDLGHLWGKRRGLTMDEMADALGLISNNRDRAELIRDYERGKTNISGPIAMLIALYLDGVRPPNGVP